MYYWRLSYPWKLSELSFLALSYCIWSAIFMLVLAWPVVSLSLIEDISFCHSFCVEGKHLSQIIFRLRSFRFFAVNFEKDCKKKDKSESTSYLKRMPAFRGIWCLIKFIDLKHEPSSLRFSSAPYHKQSSCIFDYQGIWNNIVLCSHGFF